jgi:hypothetical protein
MTVAGKGFASSPFVTLIAMISSLLPKNLPYVKLFKDVFFY